MSDALSFKVKSAAFEFKSKRGEFYCDLASVMLSSPGTSIAKILERYAERYKSEPVGVLSRHWLNRFTHVGTFSASIRGTVPQEDMATLIASESSGDLAVGLEKLGRNICALQKCKSELNKAMMTGFLLVAILHVYIAIEAFGVLPKMEKALSGAVNLADLGSAGMWLFGGAKFVRDWWIVYVVFFVATTGLTLWSLKNYTGKGRRWLDENVLPFQMTRDFAAAGFFTTIGAITTPRAGSVVQLNDALHQLATNAFPWMKWQIKLILDNLSARPNSKGEIFNTGIAGKRIYYRILDLSDSKEVPVMLREIGDIILTTAPEDIKSKAKKMTFLLTFVCLVTMLGIHGGTFSLIESFKAAAMLKAAR